MWYELGEHDHEGVVGRCVVAVAADQVGDAGGAAVVRAVEPCLEQAVFLREVVLDAAQ